MSKLVALVVLSACHGYILDERSCPFVVHASHVKGETYRCGYVDMGSTTRTHVRVAVLVFIAKGQKQAPFVFLAGGPSQSWANPKLGLNKLTANDLAASGRDYVFIEQRGTGVSEPNLACLESDGDEVGCGERLKRTGTDPADFNTLTLADDIEHVRQALKYDKIVLDGTSYGTTWARAAAARHGAQIERVLLNSVVSGTFPFLAQFASGTDEAFAALFAACTADAVCSQMFPDLDAHMNATIEALQAKPLVDEEGHPALDHDDFIFLARSLLSSKPGAVPVFLSAIETAVNSDGKVPAFFDQVVSSTDVSASNEAAGQYFAVFCADNATVSDADIDADLQRVRPSFRATLGKTAHALREVCAAYPHATAHFDSLAYTGPVLLLVGDMDPRTPPSWARDAQTTLQRGLLVVVPGEGHDVASSSPCLRRIVSQFLYGIDSPDVACVPKLTLQFATTVAREHMPVSFRHRPRLIDWLR